MGCDIHGVVQVFKDGVWRDAGDLPESLEDRSYDRFSFLTGGAVRNVGGLPKVLPLPRGLPNDFVDPSSYDDHSHSWILLSEILAVDYAQTFKNLRSGEQTLLESLGGVHWRAVLEELQRTTIAGGDSVAPEHIRIIFWFDS